MSIKYAVKNLDQYDKYNVVDVSLNCGRKCGFFDHYFSGGCKPWKFEFFWEFYVFF